MLAFFRILAFPAGIAAGHIQEILISLRDMTGGSRYTLSGMASASISVSHTSGA
jgi:hypothetical protein